MKDECNSNPGSTGIPACAPLTFPSTGQPDRVANRPPTPLVCVLLLGLVSGVAGAATTTTTLTVAPDFVLPIVEGGAFRLSAQSGLVRILFFIREDGHFVPRVLEMMEKIVASSPQYRDNAMLLCIVGLIADRAQMEQLRARFHLKWIMLEDRDHAVHRLYKVIAVPTVVIVDRQGRICARQAGFTMAFGKDFRNSLRQSLGLPPLADDELSTATKRAMRLASLGEAMARRRVWPAALRNFQDALEIDPEMHESRLGAGFCLLRLGRAKEGHDEFQRLLTADVPTTAARVGVAWALALQGNPKQAQAELEKLELAASKMPEYFEAWAAVYQAQGAPDKARQAQEKAEQLRGSPVIAPVTRPKTPGNAAPK